MSIKSVKSVQIPEISLSKLKHDGDFSYYKIHRLTGYPIDTLKKLKNGIIPEAPKYKKHFGALYVILGLSARSID